MGPPRSTNHQRVAKHESWGQHEATAEVTRQRGIVIQLIGSAKMHRAHQHPGGPHQSYGRVAQAIQSIGQYPAARFAPTWFEMANRRGTSLETKGA